MCTWEWASCNKLIALHVHPWERTRLSITGLLIYGVISRRIKGTNNCSRKIMNGKSNGSGFWVDGKRIHVVTSSTLNCSHFRSGWDAKNNDCDGYIVSELHKVLWRQRWRRRKTKELSTKGERLDAWMATNVSISMKWRNAHTHNGITKLRCLKTTQHIWPIKNANWPWRHGDDVRAPINVRYRKTSIQKLIQNLTSEMKQ